MRTCKHLVEYLGKPHEDFRLKGVKGNNKRNAKAKLKESSKDPKKSEMKL